MELTKEKQLKDCPCNELIYEDTLYNVTGEIHFEVCRKNEVIAKYSDKNLVVDIGRKRLAALAAGKVGNYTESYISHIGLGSGNVTETINDTQPKNQQLFPLTSVEVNGRDVQCNFFIADNEAIGLSIHELGLFCADGTMFSHRVRKGIIEKDDDIELKGYWILYF